MKWLAGWVLGAVMLLQIAAGLSCNAQQVFKPLPTLPVAAPSPTAAPLVSTAPAATRTAVPAFTAVSAATTCPNTAQFVADLTIPDGSLLTSAASFEKQWQILNNSGCDWDASYQVVFSKGNKLGGQDVYALYPARAGNQAIVAMQLAAPAEAGDYISEWRLVDGQGQFFGTPLTIKIRVLLPTNTP